MSSKPEPYKPSLLVKINNFIFPEGTYGEILPPESVILSENKDEINRLREAMRKHIAKKQAKKERA